MDLARAAKRGFFIGRTGSIEMGSGPGDAERALKWDGGSGNCF